MSAGTSENEKELKKVLDFTRMGSIIILLLHFYYYCYGLFKYWGYSHEISDRFMQLIKNTGLFNNIFISKLLVLLLLSISIFGNRGKKTESVSGKTIAFYLITGLVLFFGSILLLKIKMDGETRGIAYMLVSIAGYLFILAGGNLISRLIRIRLGKDVFNELNETFPQEERLLQNEYSINLPAQYNLKGKVRKSFINIINPFRGLLVCGSPGSGKTYFVIQHIIKQHIQKGFTMLVYDYKYDTLTKMAYNHLLKNKKSYKVVPAFYTINFDDLSKSHRCNPLDSSTMFDITDATEASRSIMLGLNKNWITDQGDFFVESPINFVTAIIWYLRKYKDGQYCTLPHVIELMQVPYKKLFSVLRMEPEIETLINPFVSAFENNAKEQLEGQVASAKIGMAKLSSPQLYWVLSASDFSLDINNPDAPKIICLANNPQKQQIYGAVLSLYVTRLIKLINQKDKLKSSLIFDEFPTIYFNDIDSLIATARSNKVATCLGIQDFSQLRKDYGNEQSSVIMNITGNIISGQVSGETAKALSDRFGKINQVKESISINRTDTSTSRSTHLDFAIPQSKIAGLSSGEFVGMVADDPAQKIKLKTFHCEILNNHEQLKKEADSYKELPVIRNVTPQMVNDNYLRIKVEILDIIETEIGVITNTPGL